MIHTTNYVIIFLKFYSIKLNDIVYKVCLEVGGAEDHVFSLQSLLQICRCTLSRQFSTETGTPLSISSLFFRDRL